MSKIGHFSEHWSDDKGRPAGGVSSGRGFAISWQNGPLGRGDTRREPNGAFVEDVIEACRDRLRFYQQSEFGCDENQEAIEHIEQAMEALELRTKRRIAQNVEGTHAP